MDFKECLPYIASVVCAIISGVGSYFVSRKQSKADIDKIIKQHELDIEKQRELYEMEKEKMEINFRHQMELMKKETENKLSSDLMNTVISEAMKNSAVQQKITQSMRTKRK